MTPREFGAALEGRSAQSREHALGVALGTLWLNHEPLRPVIESHLATVAANVALTSDPAPRSGFSTPTSV